MDSYDSISNLMLLMEKYETALSIQTPNEASPIALVTMKEATSVLLNSHYENTIYRLVRSKLPEITGMNINELLNLPTYKLAMLYRAVGRVKMKELEEDKSKKLDELLKGIKK